MLNVKQYLNRRLTGRQTTVAILIIMALGGLGYAAYEFIAAKVLKAKVNAALPKVCAGVREQRGKLVSAIEAYKAQFGVYPPDHVLSQQPLVVDPVTNTLLYELVGVVYNPTNKMFQVGGTEAAEEKYVKEFFQIVGFKNCGKTPDEVTNFLKIEPVPARQLHDDPDVFAVGFQVPFEDIPPEVVWEFDASPWRYVSSSPTNNPGKFDLWIELKTKYQRVVIGNWKAAE